MARDAGFSVERRRVGEAGRDDHTVVHVGFKTRRRLLLLRFLFGERAHVSRNQYSRDHRASCGAKLDSWTWRACARMPDMTRSASSRARRPAAPSTIGCVRVRTDSRKERSSARSGSSGVVGTFSNPIFGSALFASGFAADEVASELLASTRTRRTSWRVKS